MAWFPWNRRKVYHALGFFPVLFTLGLMLWSALVYVHSVVPLIAGDSRLLAALCVVSALAVWVLTMWSYVNCVFVSPGAPSGSSAPTNGQYSRVAPVSRASRPGSQDSISRRRYADDSDSGSVFSGSSDSEYSDDEGPLTTEQVRRAELVYSITVRENGQPRFCLKCNGPKPDRTHHCSVCGACVLKMDHHCPWLNNCVGFRTQKAFILFLLYGCLYCTLIFVTALVGFLRDFAHLDVDANISLSLIFLLIASCSFSLPLLVFGGYHVYLLLTNTTTIESYEENNFRVAAGSQGKEKYVNLFDLGPRRNFVQVFGPSWFMWLVPVNTTIGDGVRFPISSEGYNELYRRNID